MTDELKRDRNRAGLLIGEVRTDGLWITEIVPFQLGKQAGRSVLPLAVLTRVTEDIFQGKIKGDVMGWFHSDISGDLTVADADAEIRGRLQEVAGHILTIVVDSISEQFVVWIFDPERGLVELPNEYLRIL